MSSPGGARSALARGRRLEYLTLAWNVVEGVVSVGAGLLAGSTALVGFGVDSFIKSASGAILLWRLQDHEHHARREEPALKLVAASFFLLAAYVAFEAARSLILREPPEASWPGIVIAALSLVVMPWLARWWWADPVAALVMAPIIANEGREAWPGEACDGSCH